MAQRSLKLAGAPGTGGWRALYIRCRYPNEKCSHVRVSGDEPPDFDVVPTPNSYTSFPPSRAP